MTITWAFQILTTLILALGVVEDLRSRRVSNKWVVICALMAFGSVLLWGGWAGSLEALTSFAVAAAFMVPLFYFNVIGGGDVKLMMAAALAMTPHATLETLVFSLVWGSVLGVCLAITHGSAGRLFTSAFQVALRRPVSGESLHRMPFTIALFLGWLSYLISGGQFL